MCFDSQCLAAVGLERYDPKHCGRELQKVPPGYLFERVCSTLLRDQTFNYIITYLLQITG